MPRLGKDQDPEDRCSHLAEENKECPPISPAIANLSVQGLVDSNLLAMKGSAIFDNMSSSQCWRGNAIIE